MARARIAIVDDHPMFRRGLAVLLEKEPDFDVACEASGAKEMLAFARFRIFDLAIVDLRMAEVSGLSLCVKLREVQPSCSVLILSAVDDPSIVAGVLLAGAGGFALKTQPIEEIISAIRQVLGAVRYFPPSVTSRTIHAAVARSQQPQDAFTPRERDVFALLIRGCSNAEIANRLFMSVRTADTYRRRIGEKLSALSVAQIRRIAALYGDLVL